MTETVSPEMVERMMVVIRSVVAWYPNGSTGPEWVEQARAIAAELPAPVDPDEQAAAWVLHTMMMDDHVFTDREQAMEIARRAIRHAREPAAMRVARETEQGATQ